MNNISGNCCIVITLSQLEMSFGAELSAPCRCDCKWSRNAVMLLVEMMRPIESQSASRHLHFHLRRITVCRNRIEMSIPCREPQRCALLYKMYGNRSWLGG